MNISGKWKLKTIESYLKDSVIPLRLSVITPSGYPLVVSMWFSSVVVQLPCSKPAILP